jgi:hypothetical protein
MRLVPMVLAAPCMALIIAAGASAAVGALQYLLLGSCDPKLGCVSGIEVAAMFAAVAASLASLVYVCFLQAVSTFVVKPMAGYRPKLVSGVLAVVFALYFTWPAWSYR